MSVKLSSIRESKLAALYELNQQRLQHDREARRLAKAAKELSETILESLQADGRDSVRRGDYVAEVGEGRAYVAWKAAYIEECGEQAAERLLQAAERPAVLKVSCQP